MVDTDIDRLERVAPLKRPLLQTKLNMPRMRPDSIARPRLLDQLNRAIGEDGRILPKLTLITAPAGYGKSTLTSQWVSELGRPVAWLSLDTADNDGARFLAYLFAALATVQEEVGEAAQARLTTTYLYNDTEAILTALLNDLAASSETAVIVLDDYHLISDNGVHQAMTFILQHMPVQLHLVIAGRTQPPLPIALLRGQGALNQLNARDLRFTNEEAAQFLERTMGVTLSSEQIAVLDEQVEGWVTGLQLIGLALQEQVGLQAAFSGSQRYLVDYLADQVLNCQPPEVQEFLLRTAVLSQFNASLCDALTGRDSQTQLTHIEGANLFLIPLDAQRQWYRYHHLFADFLLGRLAQQKSEAEIADLHRRAAEWYQDNGQPLVAVEHALTAKDYELALALILEVARQVLMYGEGITLRQWVERLPEPMQTAQPDLALFYVWSLIRTGEFGRATSLLESLSDRLDSGELEDTRRLFGEYAALRARLAVMTGDTDVNIKFSQKALHKLPEDDHMLRSEVAINLGFSHLQMADLEGAREAFAEAAQNTAHDPGLWAVMFATFYWGETYEKQADLKAAFDIYRQGLALAETQTNGGAPSPAAGFMHVGMGTILYEWNRLGECETHLRRALALAQRCGDHKMLIYSREAMAQLLTTLGDWAGAQVVLDALEAQIQSPGPSTLRAILALQVGDLRTAERWRVAQNLALTDSLEQIEQLPFTYLVLARLHLSQRHYEGLERLLAELERIGEERDKMTFLVQLYLLRALLHARQGAISEALPCFQRALTLAEPGGYVRLILNYQEPSLTRLLHLTAGNGKGSSAATLAATFARTILAHLDPQEAAESEIQPLSPRELEVLGHLAAGLTNQQIAEKMVITINTVKAHTRRLYAKLDVSNRTQAVARARECLLL